MSAKQKFLEDIKSDKDFINHKENCKWKEEKFYTYSGFVTVASGSFGCVNVITHDTTKLLK